MNLIPKNIVISDSKASAYLDLLRFIAALVVFLFHFGLNNLTTNNSFLNLPVKLTNTLFNTGYQFVMVFFVLSGYFISSTVLKAISENRWSWKEYFVNRLTRLWVVLIPALLMTVVWNYLNIYLFDPKNELISPMSMSAFFSNLFFLQTIYAPVFGGNGPLWSLAYEFWYYILFPCLVLAIKSKKTTSKIMYGLLFMGMSVFLGERIMKYFFIWMLGCVIVLAKPLVIKNGTTRKLLLFASIVVSVVSLKFLYKVYNIQPWWKSSVYIADLSVALSFSILIYLIISLFNNKTENSRSVSICKTLAGFSFTLYLVHYPVLKLINEWKETTGWTIDIFNPFSILKPLSLIVVILIYAFLFAKVTEFKTTVIRKKILNMKLPFKTKQPLDRSA